MMMDPTMMDPTMMDPTMMVPGMTADAAVGASRIEMVGRGTHRSTTEDISKVKEFADNLRSSGFFDEQGVLITELPSPMLTEEDLFFSFRISARLALDLPD
ncbi:MAG: hypothetical protein GTO62_11435 [Planctomycetales bacterium]|nr:hypothetical protein [Planctomycetales bacterium]